MEKRKKAVDADNSAWGDYFYSIRGVCPWSWSAWQRDLISVGVWTGQPESLGELSARVYVWATANSDTLNRTCDVLNDEYPQWEFLWSHPEHGTHSTPQPTIIHQDHEYLTRIRSGTK